jgi:hypothetical protein
MLQPPLPWSLIFVPVARSFLLHMLSMPCALFLACLPFRGPFRGPVAVAALVPLS